MRRFENEAEEAHGEGSQNTAVRKRKRGWRTVPVRPVQTAEAPTNAPDTPSSRYAASGSDRRAPSVSFDTQRSAQSNSTCSSLHVLAHHWLQRQIYAVHSAQCPPTDACISPVSGVCFCVLMHAVSHEELVFEKKIASTRGRWMLVSEQATPPPSHNATPETSRRSQEPYSLLQELWLRIALQLLGPFLAARSNDLDALITGRHTRASLSTATTVDRSVCDLSITLIYIDAH